MRKLSEYTFSSLTYNNLTMELRGGPVFREIMRNLEAHAKVTQKEQDSLLSRYKIRLYSGHDSTVATVLQVLGVYNKQLVQYGSAVMIELYKRSLGDSSSKNTRDPYHSSEKSACEKSKKNQDNYYIKVSSLHCDAILVLNNRNIIIFVEGVLSKLYNIQLCL